MLIYDVLFDWRFPGVQILHSFFVLFYISAYLVRSMESEGIKKSQESSRRNWKVEFVIVDSFANTLLYLFTFIKFSAILTTHVNFG